MRVALPMLTLVPGISGGSETYARELTKGLARVGSHDYSVLLPRIAPDAGGGLPATVVEEYAASTGTTRRLHAMGSARVRPGRLRQYLADAEVIHYPLTVRVPTVAGSHVISLLDVQHLDLPHLFSRAERLFRHFAYDRAARIGDGFMFSGRTQSEAVQIKARIEAKLVELGRDGDAFGFESIQQYSRGDNQWPGDIAAWREAGGSHISVVTMGANLNTVDGHIEAIKRWRDVYNSVR